MKDLQLTDILARQESPLTRLAVYINGRWLFTSFNDPVRTTLQQNFYLISTPFGLTTSNALDPAKYAIKGEPGDYVAQDKNQGVLSVVTASHYSMIFPSPQQIPITPTSSEQLKNPNFITKTQQESVDQDSDKVLIGNNTFSLPSTQKKTVTIIDTPAGQAKVHYDSSGGALVYDHDLSAMIEVNTIAKPKSNY